MEQAQDERPFPRRLRLLAKKAGESPKGYVASVLSRTATIDEAAEEAEVHPETFRAWMARCGVVRSR